MVGASLRALGLVRDFSCDYMFWDERGGGLAPVGPRVDTATISTVLSTRQWVGPPVGTATITAVMGANRVDLGSFSSRYCICTGVYTHEDRRPYSATLYSTSFTLDSPLSLTISAQRKTYGWWGPMAGGDFLT